MDAEQADVSSTAVIAENVVERPEHVEVLRDFVELSETTSELRGTSNAIYIPGCSSGPEDALIPRPTHVVVEKQEGVLFRDARRPLFLLERQQSTRGSTRRSLKGPLRALRLCVLSILFPGLLVAVPLYMRYHVYSDQVYPVGMSDMRLVDSRVSTTWCQRQVVKSNATFNAFLLADHPRVQREPIKVAMTRELVLEDDMKEYWAFYLLQGSSVTVSTCCRWPGASLIVIRGHKHLHECAYIGDDSSEELEEMQANLPEGQRPVFKNGTPVPVDDGESNEPDQMKRVRPGVILHGQEVESHEILEGVDVETDIDTVLAQYLRRGGNGRSKALSMALPRSNETKKHTTRDNVSIKTPDDARGMHASNSTEDYLLESETGESHDKEKNLTTDISEVVKTTNVAPKSREIESEDAPSSPTAVPSSSEVFEEVLRKIRQLGSRGKGVLQRLNDQLSSPEEDESDNGTEERKLLRQMILDLMQEQQEDEEPAKARKRKRKHKNQTDKASNKTEEWLAESEGGDKNRERRQVYLNPGDLEDLLGMNDEDSDAAIEEGLSPDGIADHHVTLNETTLNDMSKSEFWSSFSSSEEALLSCAGLIVNLPLTPHHKCVRGRNKHELHMASHPNTLTYRVPVNGYYFFIFNSENEIQPNYIHVKFNLDKVVYNVSEPLAACQNSTVDCILPLNFFSSEKVVIELPIRNNDSLWNEEYVVVTTCEPRTALYLGCVIAVPLLILMFAFQ